MFSNFWLELNTYLVVIEQEIYCLNMQIQ